jgi:hypothetical protein
MLTGGGSGHGVRTPGLVDGWLMGVIGRSENDHGLDDCDGLLMGGILE